MSGQDRSIHVEMYLTALGRLAGSALGPAWRVSVRPMPTGVLRVDLTGERGERVAVDWGAEVSRAEPFGCLLVTEGDGPQAERCLTLLRGICARVATDARFAPVQLFNRELAELPIGDDTMDRILMRRFSPGITRVCGFAFLKADEQPGPVYSLHFANPGGVTLDALLALRGEGSLPVLEPLGPFDLSLLFGAGPGQTPRPLRAFEELEAHPEAAALAGSLRFFLKRSLHAEMLPVMQKSRTPADTGMERGQKRPDTDTAVATWRTEGGANWRRFLFPYEIEHDATGQFNFMDDYTFLEHGELECNYVQVFGQGKIRNHLPIWPSDYHGPLAHLNPGGPRDEAKEKIPRNFYTYLGEGELISGSLDRLSDALSYMRDNRLEREVILFNDTCVARLLGEDMQMVLHEHERKGGSPVLMPDKTYTSHTGMQANLLSQVLRRTREIFAQEGPPQAEPDSYTLIGYPPDRALEELVEVLSLVGVSLKAILIPRMGAAELAAALRSSLFVVTPFPGWSRAFEKIELPVERPRIQPELPYGVDASLGWVTTILEALGREGAALPHDHIVRVRERMEAQHQRIAGRFGLGFVVDAPEVERLVTPGAFFGVPLLPLLAGFGFGLTFFLYSHNPEGDIPRVRERLQARAGAATPVEVVAFCDKPGFVEALRRDETAQAIYSQFSFDTRILSAGKATFSLIDIEKGVEGALRTAQRLMEKCLWRGPGRFGLQLQPKDWPT